MSECDKCFDNFFRGLGTKDCIMPDGICQFRPMLKALPGASEEQVRRMTAIANGVFECRYCVHGITNSCGMTWCVKWVADQPLDYVCAMWTERKESDEG